MFTEGGWVTEKPIEILSIDLTKKNIRDTTDVTVRFYLPYTTFSVMNVGDYISMSLPYQWGNVLTKVGWVGQVKIEKETKDGIKTNIGSTILGYTGSTIVAKIDAFGT